MCAIIRDRLQNTVYIAHDNKYTRVKSSISWASLFCSDCLILESEAKQGGVQALAIVSLQHWQLKFGNPTIRFKKKRMLYRKNVTTVCHVFVTQSPSLNHMGFFTLKAVCSLENNYWRNKSGGIAWLMFKCFPIGEALFSSAFWSFEIM